MRTITRLWVGYSVTVLVLAGAAAHAGSVRGHVSIDGLPAADGTSVICKDSRPAPPNPSAITTGGEYYCHPEAVAGPVSLIVNGQPSPTCPTAVPESGEVVCNASLTEECKSGMNITTALLAPGAPVVAGAFRRGRRRERG